MKITNPVGMSAVCVSMLILGPPAIEANAEEKPGPPPSVAASPAPITPREIRSVIQKRQAALAPETKPEK